MKAVLEILFYDLMRRNAVLLVKVLYRDVWRLRQQLKTRQSKIKSALYYQYFASFGASIGLGAEIAAPPIFPHGVYGVFVSEAARIGKNVTIFHQVTIGSNTIKSSRHVGVPVVEDGVFIGCGAKIIGGVRIGRNARIGANAVVVHDVPPNAVVVSARNRVIQHEEELFSQFVPIK